MNGEGAARNTDHASAAYLVLGFTKALVWPLLAGVALVVFWGPLRDLAAIMPSKVRESESITWGSFSLNAKSSSSFVASASPAEPRKGFQNLSSEVRQVLRGLDDSDLSVIMSFKDVSITAPGRLDESDSKRYTRLVNLKLLREMSPQELKQESKRNNEKEPSVVGFTTTALWDETQAALIALLPEMLHHEISQNTQEKGKEK